MTEIPTAVEAELARLRAENARLLRLLKMTSRQAAPPGPTQAAFLDVPPGMVDDGSSGLMRTATTGEHARRWFRRYRTFGVGSSAHILVRALLEMVRETAEGAQAAVAGQAR